MYFTDLSLNYGLIGHVRKKTDVQAPLPHPLMRKAFRENTAE